MRKTLPLLSILLLLAAAPAAAQDDYIGLFTTTDASTCDAPLGTVGLPVTVEVMAVVPSFTSGITAVEFSADNLPVSGTDGIVSIAWAWPLTIGNIYDGIAIAFGDAQAGPLVHLGTITLIDITGSWVGDDHIVTIQGGASGEIVVVDDVYDTYPVAGGQFTFNCTAQEGCECLVTQVTACELVPPAWNFGDVPIGESGIKDVELVNTGETVIEGIVAAGCEDFGVTAGAGAYTIGPGESHVVTIEFAPLGTGSQACFLDLGDNACDEILLQGTGIGGAPDCSIDTALLDFGEVLLGETGTLSFEVANLGTATLEFSILPWPCVPDSTFYVLNAGTHQLGAGASVDIVVRATPLDTGIFGCDIDLGTDCPPVTVTCEGVATAADCQLSTELVDFGPVTLGEDALGYVTVSNTGAAPFDLDLPATPCADTPAFTILNDGLITVPAGGEFTVQIRFMPTEVGPHECTLDLGGNDCPPVLLTGLGQEFTTAAGNHIGMYVDMDAQICETPLDGAGQVVYARIFAVLPDFEGEGITAVEFRLDNLPPNNGAPNGMWTVEWTTDLVIGEPSEGVALAFPEGPRPGPLVELGLITFRSLDQTDWVGPDHVVTATEPLYGGDLVVVDENFNTLPVGGGTFTFNCTDPEGCVCYEEGEPICSVTPGQLDFGTVDIGSSAVDNFIISNSGDGVLIGFVQESCPDFVIVYGAGFFAIEPGVSHSVQIRFMPSEAGEQLCEINLGTPYCDDVIATGTGWVPVPICELVPDSLVFEEIVAGTTATQNFLIRNIGSGYIEGTVSESCEDYTIIAGAGPFSVGTQQSHNVIVEFHPPVPGDYPCVIELANEFCDQMQVFGSAREPTPGCELLPPNLDFGDIALGISVVLEAEIANTGDNPLSGEVALDDPHFALVTGGGPFTVDVGESHALSVRYAPQEIGSHAAVLSTGLELCAELPLTGMAHEPAPTCDIAPPALDFGEVLLDDYAQLGFVVSNDGDGPLVGEVALDDANFHLIGGAGAFTLLPGEVHTVTVRYDPASYGAHAALVTLGAEVCADVPLSGFARNPVVGGDHIGLYGDTGGTVCSADLEPFVTTTLYFLAVVPSFATDGITAVEFRLDGLEALSAQADIVGTWETFDVSGDLLTGVRLGFDPAEVGEIVPLGEIHVTPNSAIDPDFELRVMASLDGLQLSVTDHEGLGWDVNGDRFTVNCTDPELCDCLDFESGICELSDDLLDFGVVGYGVAEYRDFTLTNAGYGPLSGDLQVTGDYFHLSVGEGPFLLMPGEVLMATAYFQPGAAGNFEGLITTGLESCPELPLTGAGVGGGGGSPFIGLFAEPEAVACTTPLDIYTYANVYVSALLPEWMPGITAAEFRIDNLPGPQEAIRTDNWNTQLVIGDLDYGIALAFEPPIYGPVAVMGRLEFFGLSDLGYDYLMEVRESNASGNLVVVGLDYVEYWANAGIFWFNCSTGWCDCGWATPVSISLFELADAGGKAEIHWQTESTGGVEFRLLGSRDGFEWTVPHAQTAPGDYRAVDASSALSEPGEVTYRLFGREPGSDWQPLREERLTVAGISYPTRLLAAHPNPFNPKVSVPFSLAETSRVRVVVYDVSGRRVATLADGQYSSGEHTLIWEGRDDSGLPAGSGIYFVHMESKGHRESQKLVLLR